MKHFFSLRRGGLAAGLLLLLAGLAGPAARAQAPAWQSLTAFAPTNAATYSSLITSTATDAAGNVYVAGQFSGTVTLGSTTLTSAGGTDVFVGKWDPRTAALVWVQRAGGPGTDAASGLAVSGSSVYVVGAFVGPAAFGGTTLNSAAGDSNFFVAKLTDAGATGSFAWALGGGGATNTDQAYGVAVSGSSVYVSGYFAGPAAFGPVTLTTAGIGDAFVAKLTDAGPTAGFVWAQRCGGPGTGEVAYNVATRGADVYLTGYFSGTATFGPLSLASAGSNDAFVAKLTDAGPTSSFVWALQAGGLADEYAFALAAGPGSSLYMVGRFDSRTVGFGATTLTNAALNSSSVSPDVFVAKLADAGPTGSFVWAQSAGGSGVDIAVNVAVRGASVYAVGHFQATATFGSSTLTSAGGTDIDVFVTKLVDAGPSSTFAWTQTGGGTGFDFGYGLALSGSSVYATGSLVAPASFGAGTVPGRFGGPVGYLASLSDPTLLATTAAQGAPGFTLAPNPARATAAVQLPAVPGAPTATLTLTDALGRVVRTETVALPPAGLRHALDLRGLAPGVYAVQARGGAVTATQRLVVE